MKTVLAILFCFASAPLFSQNPVPIQVSYPVYFDDVKFPRLQSPDLPPMNHLCGVAMLYLDTSMVNKELVFSGMDEPIILLDHVGISTKLSFIITDSLANKTSLEFLYSNNTCAASIMRNDSIISIGNMTKDQHRYSLRMIGNNYWHDEISAFISTLNYHLLRLHTKKLKQIPINGMYNSDSLNVILGYDYSFDTDNDLSWFDESLRNRIKDEAAFAYNSLLDDNKDSLYVNTIKTNSLVFHTASLDKDNNHLTHGKVSTIFKMNGEKNYLFLQAKKEYLMEIGYTYQKEAGKNGRLMLDKFTIKNMENNDFIDMTVFDLTDNGVPILYVDLISGVVMEDTGAWKAVQFITAIQDIFRLVRLPGEG